MDPESNMDITVKFWKTKPDNQRHRDKIEIFEYPSREQMLNLRQNTGYCYVSDTYLNGLVNYVSPLYLICSQKYSNDEEFDRIIKELEDIDMNTRPCKWYHTNLAEISDNTYYIGENKISYLLFNYDRDNSDCMIIRFDKMDFTFNQVKEYLLDQAAYESFWYSNNDINEFPRYIELPKPQGWIKG